MQLRPPAEEDLPKEDFLPQLTFRVYYYLNDHLGTPQEMLDKRGNLVWQALTSPYGEILKLKENKKIPNPIRLPGQYADEESGLYYNRFRYYHPQDGSYLSKDPIGLLGGMNLYDDPRDPVNWGDPLGLMGTCDGTKTPAQRLADKAQNLSNSKRPRVVAVIEHADGTITVGRKKGGVINNSIQS